MRTNNQVCKLVCKRIVFVVRIFIQGWSVNPVSRSTLSLSHTHVHPDSLSILLLLLSSPAPLFLGREAGEWDSNRPRACRHAEQAFAHARSHPGPITGRSRSDAAAACLLSTSSPSLFMHELVKSGDCYPWMPLLYTCL